MTVVSRLAAGDFRTQPWRNGGGTTTEIAVHPARGRPLWRVSIAEVATSGPFSDFTGYERTILLLQGEGMRLSFDAAPPLVVDRPHVPFAFDGGARCHCELLGGAVRDMNLMVERAAARGGIEVISGSGESTRAIGAEWSLFYTLAGSARVALEGAVHALAPGEALRLDGIPTTRVSLSCDGPAARLAMLTIEKQRQGSANVLQNRVAP